jgi:hypothetical protein
MGQGLCRSFWSSWAYVNALMNYPFSLEFRTSTSSAYQSPASTQQNLHTPPYFEAQLYLVRGSEYGKHGHLTNVVFSYGWWLIIASGQQIGWPAATFFLWSGGDDPPLFTTCVFARQFWSTLLQQAGLAGLFPEPSEASFDDWWRHVISSVHNTLKGGLSSLFILGAWTLWRHRNDCVFNGVSSRVCMALGMAREEAWAWCMTGAKGLPLLTFNDLATVS